MKVLCGVDTFDRDPESRVRGPCVQVTCGRCGNAVVASGTSDKSVRYGFVKLKESCPNKESNYYYDVGTPAAGAAGQHEVEHAIELSGDVPALIAANRFVVVHAASTGLGDQSELVQLAFATVDHGKPGWRATTLVKPTASMTEGAVRVSGLTDADLDSAPSFAEVVEPFAAACKDRILLGIALEKYLLPLFLRELQRGGHSVPWRRILDVLDVSRTLEPGARNFSLAGLLQRCRLPELEDGASTLQRVRAIWLAFYTLIEKFPAADVPVEMLTTAAATVRSMSRR